MELRARIQAFTRWAAQSPRPWLGLSWLGLALLCGLIAVFGRDAGLSYDEPAQRKYGDMILAWFRSGFRDRTATHFSDLYLYGGLFDAVAQWLTEHSPLPVFDTRHLLTALTALLGVVASWKMAAALGGPRAGFFGALVLALTPCWVGHGLFNPKDIPFGTAAAFATLAAQRLAMGPAPLPLRAACWAGVTAGIALAVRPGGWFVLGYPCLAAGARLALEFWRRRRASEPLQLGRLALNLVLCVVLVVAIAWPIMLIAWPWAQLDPLWRPIEAMQVAKNFDWEAQVLFDGKMIDADKLPRRYLPVWFRITLPETYLLAALAGVPILWRLARRRDASAEQTLGAGILACGALLPLAAVLITRPVLYDAQRHVLFLLPPAAALAGCALSEVLSADWLPRALRGAFAGILVALTILVGIDMVQLHPYEYVYFNRLHGGLRKQYRRFETDYWSVSYREGMAWVLNDMPRLHPGRRTRLASCDRAGEDRLRIYLNEWAGARDRLRVMSAWESADVFLAVRRFKCHRAVHGEVLHVVRRQGVPLLYVRLIDHKR